MLLGLLIVLLIIAVLYFTDAFGKDSDKPAPQQYKEVHDQAIIDISGVEDAVREQQAEINR